MTFPKDIDTIGEWKVHGWNGLEVMGRVEEE